MPQRFLQACLLWIKFGTCVVVGGRFIIYTIALEGGGARMTERCAHTSRRAKRVRQRCRRSVVRDPAILGTMFAETLRATMGFAIGATGPFWFLAFAFALSGRALDVPALTQVKVGANRAPSFGVGVSALVMPVLVVLELSSSPPCLP